MFGYLRSLCRRFWIYLEKRFCPHVKLGELVELILVNGEWVERRECVICETIIEIEHICIPTPLTGLKVILPPVKNPYQWLIVQVPIRVVDKVARMSLYIDETGVYEPLTMCALCHRAGKKRLIFTFAERRCVNPWV